MLRKIYRNSHQIEVALTERIVVNKNMQRTSAKSRTGTSRTHTHALDAIVLRLPSTTKLYFTRSPFNGSAVHRNDATTTYVLQESTPSINNVFRIGCSVAENVHIQYYFVLFATATDLIKYSNKISSLTYRSQSLARTRKTKIYAKKKLVIFLLTVD